MTHKGGVFSYGLNVYGENLAVRPAFNLDLNSVLFTSAAVGGKSANGMDSGLTAVGDYDGSEWKLTLLDETREFAVTEQTVSGKPGDTLRSITPGATTGENEYISVIIADENGAQYYGRVAQRAEKAERRPFPFLPTLRPEVIPLMCSASSTTAANKTIPN